MHIGNDLANHVALGINGATEHRSKKLLDRQVDSKDSPDGDAQGLLHGYRQGLLERHLELGLDMHHTLERHIHLQGELALQWHAGGHPKHPGLRHQSIERNLHIQGKGGFHIDMLVEGHFHGGVHRYIETLVDGDGKHLIHGDLEMHGPGQIQVDSGDGKPHRIWQLGRDPAIDAKFGQYGWSLFINCIDTFGQIIHADGHDHHANTAHQQQEACQIGDTPPGALRDSRFERCHAAPQNTLQASIHVDTAELMDRTGLQVSAGGVLPACSRTAMAS